MASGLQSFISVQDNIITTYILDIHTCFSDHMHESWDAETQVCNRRYG